MSLTRRELCSMFPAMVIPAMVSPVAAVDDAQVLPSAMFPFEKLTPHKSNAAEIRPVLKGKLATGESVEVHETTLPPGGMPHAPPHYLHTEMSLLWLGKDELAVA